MFTRTGCMKAILLIVIIVGAIAATSYYLISKKPPRPTVEPPSPYENQVRVGLIENTGRPASLPLYVINSLIMGKGYEVVFVRLQDTQLCWQRLASGDLDLIIAPLDDIALGMVRHSPGVIVFKAVTGSGGDAVVVSKSITRPSELAGRKVAVVPGTTSFIYLKKFLDKIDSVGRKCTIISVPTQAKALDALIQRRVDAAVLSDPCLEEALRKNFKDISLPDSVHTVEEYCVVGNGIRNNHPERVVDIVRAWFKLVDLLEKSPGRGKRLICESSGTDPEKLDAYFSRVHFVDLKENKEITDREILRKLEASQQDWSLEREKNAQLPVDFKNCIDLSIIGDKLSIDDIINEPEPSPTVPSTASPSETPSGMPPELPIATPSMSVSPSESPGTVPTPSATKEKI